MFPCVGIDWGIKVASVQEVAAAYASVAARWDSLTLIVSSRAICVTKKIRAAWRVHTWVEYGTVDECWLP
jgi:hypothetical protein